MVIYMAGTSLWTKIDLAVLNEPEDPSTPKPAKSSGQDSEKRQRMWVRRLKYGWIAGVLIWVPALIKLFVFDFDRYTVERFAPSLGFLVDLRFFAILALAAVVIGLTRKSFFWVAFIGLFPLVAACGYVPYLLYKIRSWTVVLVFINVLFGFFDNFKRNFLLRTLELVALATILWAPTSKVALLLAAFVISLGMLFHFARAMKQAIVPSRFLRSQERMISNFLGLGLIRHMMTVQPDLRSDELEKFSKLQLTQFGATISWGLLSVQGIDFYTHLLERYRRSGSGMTLALTSFIWLFIQSVVALTLINWAIWRIWPGQYSTQGKVSLLDFVYYSLSSIFVNGVPSLEPAGAWTLSINVAAGFYGPLLLMALALQLIFGFKQSRDEASFSETIAAVQRRRRDLEAQLEREYELPLDEALEKLQAYGIGFVALFGRLAAGRSSRSQK